MNLLVDIGNSRLKWALTDGSDLAAGAVQASAQQTAPDFAVLFKDIKSVEAVWIASVAAPALDEALADAVRRRFGVTPSFVRSSAAACGVRNAYRQPERLGVDRFLGLIAAHAYAQQATVIASCGTALTLDALGADGTHAGGLIAPAPALMREALLARTARLGDLENARVIELADNTADAVESGTWLAAVALIERFVARTSARLGAPAALVLSGGGAARLSQLLDPPHRLDSALVLRGLARYAEAVR